MLKKKYHKLHCRFAPAAQSHRFLYHDDVKSTSKSSILNTKEHCSPLFTYSDIFIAQHCHWLFYIPVNWEEEEEEEEGQTQISSLFVQQRWFQNIETHEALIAWREPQSCVFIATQVVTLRYEHLNHYCLMVRSDATHAHTHAHTDTRTHVTMKPKI